MVTDVFSGVLSVVGQFVSSIFTLPFFGFPSFGVFFLVCFALSLVGWVLKSFSGGDDK
jgi:hypothetical protein